MLKDVERKEVSYLFYTDEYSLNRMLVAKMALGDFKYIVEPIRSYTIVNPEFYVFSYSGVAMFNPFVDEQTAMKIIWSGCYFMNQDLNILNEQDIYDCWLDTANEIKEFLQRNGWNFAFHPPTFGQALDEIQKYLQSVRNVK